jgi:hypothetical protein
MQRESTPHAPSPLLYVIAAAAVLLGLWGRFKGLGVWPLNADEYYIARSVQNILRTGLPEYACGGLYIRGLAFQYVVALLQFAGMTPEFSARLVASACSIVALPAVYILGRRMGGRPVALLAVSLMALSVWEVDIARFGRMYAPFQAVFVWYLVFFLRYTVDGERRACWPMVLLSVLGVFTWEGGLLVMAVNLLPPLLQNPGGRFGAREIRYLLFMGALMALAFAATRMVDFRVAGTQPFPAEYVRESLRQGSSMGLVHAPRSRWAIAGLLLTAGLAFACLRRIWALRERWPAALGLLAAVVCVLLHQFGACAIVIIVLLLSRMVEWQQLRTQVGWPFVMLILASLAAWTIELLSNPAWLAAVDTPWEGGPWVMRLVYAFFQFPDVLSVVALPWARSAPLLGAGLLGLLAAAAIHAISKPGAKLDDLSVLLLLIACLLAGASVSHPPRFETRYVFFLYPAALLVATATVFAFSSGWGKGATWAAVILLLGGFALSGDLQPRRLLAIDSADSNFGDFAKRGERSNILGRSDVRGAARWLADNRGPQDTLIVNGFPGVDFYFDGFDFAYIDQDNQRYEAYACNRGTVERWGNLPLLSSIEDLNAKVAASRRTLMTIDAPALEAMRGRLTGAAPRVRWVSRDGYVKIIEIVRPADPT